jgi:hypothetical protein
MIKTLIIVFSGLVAHIQLPNSTVSTAALPIDKHHFASLRFRPEDIVLRKIRNKPEELDEWFATYLSQDEIYVIPLSGLHVKISGLDPKDTDTAAVRDLIPSLTKVSSCQTLKKSIINRTPDNDFGFVDYSGGVLMANAYFDTMGYVANVPGWDVPRCMPAELQLITPVVDDAAKLIFITKGGEAHEVALRPGTHIEVFNSSLPQHPGHKKTKHFENYSSLFSGWCSMDKVLAAGECRKSGLTVRKPAEPDPDCTNSHYP